jgi:hypothetical protein
VEFTFYLIPLHSLFSPSSFLPSLVPLIIKIFICNTTPPRGTATRNMTRSYSGGGGGGRDSEEERQTLKEKREREKKKGKRGEGGKGREMEVG